MKIRAVHHNNRRKAFEVRTSTKLLLFPFAKVDPRPTPKDPIADVFVDDELGREGFTYVLSSGREGTVHIDQILEYNQDPGYLRSRLLYALTLKAQKIVQTSDLPKRELIRRMGTSATQFYRLLDQTNYRKSVDQMLRLLQVLDCQVDVAVRPRQPAS